QATVHGETRFDQNFALGELIIEYGLLRPILIEEIAADLDRAITVEEAQALHMAVDVVLRRSVTSFVNQQKVELGALAEAQTKYLSFLSHDLRGNLNGVLLMIEVLRRDLQGEEKFATSLQDLDMMRRSILETVGTMDRFLHAERFRNGKVQVRPAKVSLLSLVSEIVGQFSYHAKDKRLELKHDVPDGAVITSDRELLQMILQNLVGNALKYSQRGEVRIAVKDMCEENRACRLSVLDQGPGIAPERLVQMFQPFARGETHGQQGTGLGLSIAMQAATLLGAQLWAESKVGDGTTFHLDLPPAPPDGTPGQRND
ncbi:MAG: HAMP domain-containing sensor histidine kinase, partial [Tepidisphaeraceae bacterium]